jgi:hypothetical protein
MSQQTPRWLQTPPSQRSSTTTKVDTWNEHGLRGKAADFIPFFKNQPWEANCYATKEPQYLVKMSDKAPDELKEK